MAAPPAGQCLGCFPGSVLQAQQAGRRPEYEEAALPSPKPMSMYYLAGTLAYLLENTGLVQIDHLGTSECLMLQFHSLGL